MMLIFINIVITLSLLFYCEDHSSNIAAKAIGVKKIFVCINLKRTFSVWSLFLSYNPFGSGEGSDQYDAPTWGVGGGGGGGAQCTRNNNNVHIYL